MSRNTIAVAGFALLLGAAAARPASAMTDDDVVKAHVPFAFRVSGERMPAGDYEIRSLDTLHGVIEIRRAGGGPAAVSLTTPKGLRSIKKARLVFDRVGNQRFLRAVLLPGEGGVEIPVVGGAEVRAARAVAADASHGRTAGTR